MSNFSKETAERLMTLDVPIVGTTATVGEVEHLLKTQSKNYNTINYVYITGETGDLRGVISIRELFTLERHDNVFEKSVTDFVTVRTSTDQERVAHLALKYNIKAVPVVSKDHTLLGVVPSDKILEILNHEHTKDVLRFAGVRHKHSPVQDVLLDQSPLTHVKSRLPWLVIGLLGGVLAAFVIGIFEETLAHELLLAAFIPAIVYMADAVGSQTQMLFVRALAVDQNLKVKTYLFRESIVNALLGALLAVLIFIVSFMWVGSFEVSTILGLSIFLTVISTVFVAIALPWFFHLRGQDPAIASGPLSTVVHDLLSLFIYLLIASAFLG